MIFSNKIFKLDKIAVNRDKLFELKDYDGYTPELLYKRLQSACQIFNLENKLNHMVKIKKTIKGILIIKTFKMENKEKVFLDTLLEKINDLSTNKYMFPAFHEHSSKGKLELQIFRESDEYVEFCIQYKNEDFIKNVTSPTKLDKFLYNNEKAISDLYNQIITNLLFNLMFGEGSIKHDIPLIGDLTTKGKYWKENLSELKNNGIFIKYRD